MTTPLLALSEVSEGVVNQATAHNTALRQMEARSFRVLSMTETTPAVGAAESDCYIIPTGATGVWAGRQTQMASWIGGAWSYYEPVEGIGGIWVNDEDTAYSFDGTSWVATGGSGITAPFSDSTALVKGSVDSTKRARFEVDGLTAATTRVVTVQDKDGTMALLDDVGGTTATAGALINGATSKATPVDADYIGLMDSAASNILKKLSWANIKVTLKAYFDTFYCALASVNVFTKNQSVAVVSLGSGISPAINASLSNNFKITLGANNTLVDPTNLTEGMILNFAITQDATGSRTLAYGSLYKFPGGTAPVLSTAANSKDFMSCYYDGAVLLCQMNKAFA